jgi:hypothetical protein
MNRKIAKIIPKTRRILPESPSVNSKDKKDIRKIIDNIIKLIKISLVD